MKVSLQFASYSQEKTVGYKCLVTQSTLHSFPFLAAIICPALSEPMNGQVNYSNASSSVIIVNNQFRIKFGTTATYTCVKGFSLVGVNTKNCTGDGSSTIGAFSGIDNPTCECE